MKQKLIGAFCLSIAASIWGGTYVVSKFMLNQIPPFTLIWLRYMVAFLFLFTVLRLVERKQTHAPLRKKDWLLLGWIGFIGYFLSISLQFIGTKLSDAHTGALITSTTPAFLSLFAALILKETFTLRKIIALLLATIGVVTIIGWNTHMHTYFWGSIILVGAGMTWAILSVYVKIAATRISSLSLTTYAILFALLFTTPCMIWEVQSTPIYYHNLSLLFGILYLGIISTAGAFFLWNKGMEYMDAGVGGLFLYFQPIVAALLGWIFLHEKLTVHFFIGGFLILIGVLFVSIPLKVAKENHSV